MAQAVTWNPRRKGWLGRRGSPKNRPEPSPRKEVVTDLIPDKPLFRVDEVAEICSVHENTVRNWLETGKLEAIRLPNDQIRISRSSLLKILSN